MVALALPVLLALATAPGELVRQLGAPDYADREAAGRALRRLGWLAEPAVRAATRSADPEVARRAVPLLAAIRADGWAAFAAGRVDLPGPVWPAFAEVAGNTPAARALFARAAADGRLDDLDRAVADPTAAAELYAAAIDRLNKGQRGREAALPGAQDNLRLLPDGPSAGPAVALLFLGTLPRSPDVPAPPDPAPGRFARLPDQLPEAEADPLTKLFAAWLARRRGV